ncbi:hypothetical protein, conserved in T. vivax [Trypanosoma vivax Y486]|uniref:Uncharacterized protein n=1 Tax=Trypanosoma vivax (strain Y486) TaxID=1055687 RepID=F9WUE1_TRYVY|nr:hypothetical protein, conserved in T. vivax [Trypanosoma vivax Y486]|eukprot:CCD21190.1 hypothetical protein, conserved in T. vivax [Trypanosoma vivax Y486]
MAATRRGRASGGFASGEHRCVVREPARADATVLRVERTRGTQRRARRPAWHRRVGTGNTCAQQEGAKARAAIVGSPKRFFAATLQRCERNGQERDATVGGNWFSGYERMTQLALAMACLLAGTLVSTRRGSATSAAKGANIGAASILCEAALQADAISAQAKALPCDAVKRTLEVTLNSVPAEVWAHALTHSGRLGKRTLQLVGNWTASATLDKFCAGAGQGTDTRVCSAKAELDTCTKKATEAQTKVTEAVAPASATDTEKWWVTNDTHRERQRTRRTCASVPRWSTCARARTTVTHASARERKQANSAEETHTQVKLKRGRSRKSGRKQRQRCARQNERTEISEAQSHASGHRYATGALGETRTRRSACASTMPGPTVTRGASNMQRRTQRMFFG